MKNLEWLVKLHARVCAKMAEPQQSILSRREQGSSANGADELDAEDAELLGWKTRLIERATQNQQTAKTIQSPNTPAASFGMETGAGADALHFVPMVLNAGETFQAATDNSTDALVSCTGSRG